jgi:hypothetical protein
MALTSRERAQKGNGLRPGSGKISLIDKLRDVPAEGHSDFYSDIGLDDVLTKLFIAEALITKMFLAEMLLAAISLPPTEDSIKIFFSQFVKWMQFPERRARGHWEVSVEWYSRILFHTRIRGARTF